MRPLKLRAWDKINKRMIYIESFSQIPSNWKDVWILMLFTGKHGMLGIEVFDGDKVACMHKGSIIEGIIYWSDYMWMVKDVRGGNATRLGKVNIIRVIGNIFEGGE